MGVDPRAPAAIKVGYCRLEGAPSAGGVPLDTRILIFENEDHLESLPSARVLSGQALVYGDTWEVYVVPPDRGRDVQEAIGGDLLEGSGDIPVLPSGEVPSPSG